jgi:hypothetical protein
MTGLLAGYSEGTRLIRKIKRHQPPFATGFPKVDPAIIGVNVH